MKRIKNMILASSMLLCGAVTAKAGSKSQEVTKCNEFRLCSLNQAQGWVNIYLPEKLEYEKKSMELDEKSYRRSKEKRL